MSENVIREQSASSTGQDVSPSRQTCRPAQDTLNWSGRSAGLGTFDFTSAPSDVSIPSFGPAIAALADLSFTQPSASSMPDGQPDVFQARDFHDKKRTKVEPDTPALDSIDYWISFDDDLDKMGSFEIDYSKRPALLSQDSRIEVTSESTPGLGSGLYATATAPFREEDFFDDSAFEQAMSDDEEEVFESRTNMNAKPTDPANQSASQPSIDNSTDASQKHEGLDPFQPDLRLASAVRNVPRQMRRGVYAPAPSTAYDEQRRFLEEALSSGKIPGALIPPNGFGIGFGAGMGGCRPPQQFEEKSPSPRSQLSEGQTKSMSAKNGDVSDEPDLEPRKKTKRVTSTARPTAAKKSALSTVAPKVKSADRIAHNDVERKYRTNLKDKIAELRAAVPALQTSGADGDSEGGSAAGQQSRNKISKGTVLTKATEYIHQLEARNKAIVQEHQQLSRRIQAFETLLNTTGSQADLMMPNHSMTLFDPRGFC
ncbi:hypothetical protein EsDP_00004134 [Epichloe bromicola]|uniref:BHLH domain-containing protein n=1 Tax=Epichloe bromicola TaxID=79588 RepID=A0ABQ0CQT7_9HYPO